MLQQCLFMSWMWVKAVNGCFASGRLHRQRLRWCTTLQPSRLYLQSQKEVLRQSLTCSDRCTVSGNKFHQPQNLLCQCGQLLRKAKALYSVGACLITQTITSLNIKGWLGIDGFGLRWRWFLCMTLDPQCSTSEFTAGNFLNSVFEVLAGRVCNNPYCFEFLALQKSTRQ